MTIFKTSFISNS